ncbi:hypothetical protein BGX27_004829, partial [Mortierella sp. AM989]
MFMYIVSLLSILVLINEFNTKLVIFCLLDGEPSSQAFPVEIKGRESVGALKEAIKGKKPIAFKDVDPDALILWHVSIPPSPKRKITLNNLEIDEKPTELKDPTSQMSA